jgi:hypothetical protein
LEDFEPKVLRELSCTWCFPTDGLAFYQDWYTVEGKYRRLLREIESIINGKGNIETSWIGAKSMARSPEGLLDWLGLPRSIKTLMSVPNKQIWKYAIYLYNKDCSR